MFVFGKLDRIFVGFLNALVLLTEASNWKRGRSGKIDGNSGALCRNLDVDSNGPWTTQGGTVGLRKFEKDLRNEQTKGENGIREEKSRWK